MRGRQGQGTGGPLVTALSSQRPHEKGIRMTTTEYRVTGMTCGHCESSVRSAVSDIDGVKQVEVSAATGKLVITSDAPPSDTAVLAAVVEAGYTAVRVG